MNPTTALPSVIRTTTADPKGSLDEYVFYGKPGGETVHLLAPFKLGSLCAHRALDETMCGKQPRHGEIEPLLGRNKKITICLDCRRAAESALCGHCAAEYIETSDSGHGGYCREDCRRAGRINEDDGRADR